MIRTLAIILLISLAKTVAAQTNEHVQWASEVLDVSSEGKKAGEKGYGADQALGKPNKCPAPGDSPCTWMPGNAAEEYIKVGFERPMKIVQVVVAENLNPDAVSKIILYDEKDKERDSYSSQPEAQGVGPHMHHLIINRTQYNVAAVKVILAPGVVPGPNEIDAIGISDAYEKVEAEINVAPDIRVGPRENLGPGVNSQYDEVLPVISPDGKTLFVDRKNHPQNIRVGGAPFSVNDTNNDNIWYSQLDSRNNWTALTNIGPQLNNGYGSFVASVTPDGNTLLLGGSFQSKRLKQEHFGLWLSHRTKTGWSTPEEVIVKDFYTKAQFVEFSLSNDGRTIVLSLDRADSHGKKDLYVSFLIDDGSTWSTPKNLGPIVNSAADEATPFIAADGKTLYFASDGFAGYGGMDMFITRRLDDTWQHWTEPQNLGPQLNTPGWDAYYTLPASGEYAYFVSTENSYGAGDVFRVKLPEALKPQAVVLISGKVLEAKSGKPIGAAIKYEDLETGKEIGSASTNPTTGIYKITLPAGHNYGYRAEASGYIPISENLDLTNEKSYHELERDLTLVPFEMGEVVRVNNIFFETGKATLRPESSPELDRIVKLLNDHPTMEISIAGHTDSVGTPTANKQLSEDRANAVQTYLISKGIAAKRLRTHGYGETQPIAPNTTESGRQQNRRVEFTIVKQ